ncbi:hypothetical protein AB0M29_45070, partial [Streptomyces sp. NPDC051976]
GMVLVVLLRQDRNPGIRDSTKLRAAHSADEVAAELDLVLGELRQADGTSPMPGGTSTAASREAFSIASSADEHDRVGQRPPAEDRVGAPARLREAVGSPG